MWCVRTMYSRMFQTLPLEQELAQHIGFCCLKCDAWAYGGNNARALHSIPSSIESVEALWALQFPQSALVPFDMISKPSLALCRCSPRSLSPSLLLVLPFLLLLLFLLLVLLQPLLLLLLLPLLLLILPLRSCFCCCCVCPCRCGGGCCSQCVTGAVFPCPTQHFVHVGFGSFWEGTFSGYSGTKTETGSGQWRPPTKPPSTDESWEHHSYCDIYYVNIDILHVYIYIYIMYKLSTYAFTMYQVSSNYPLGDLVSIHGVKLPEKASSGLWSCCKMLSKT